MNWKHDPKQRWAVALLFGFALTVAGGYAYKYLIESTSKFTYTIHWLETVPFITIFLAFMLQREWKKTPASDEEE